MEISGWRRSIPHSGVGAVMGIFFTGLRRGNLLGQFARGLALALGLIATQPAFAFDAAISSFNSGARSSWPVLAGFESMATQDPNGATLDYCRVRHENLRVGPTLGFNRAGNSIIDLRGFLGNSGFIRSIAPREIFDNVVSNVPTSAPSLTSASAADVAQACSITDFSIVSQTSPNGTNYANSSYHGIIFRGRQDGVLYQWEVAFSGQTNTQFINTRTLVVAAPTVTRLTPASGPAAGGNNVVIEGTNLSGATAVNFGTTPATNLVVNSPTQITATAPAGTSTVNVSVTTPGGTSANNGTSDDYTYVAPTFEVSGVSVNSAVTAGGVNDYRMNVTARNSATNGRVTLTMTLPTGVTFLSDVSFHGWVCSNAAQVVTCTVDTSIAQNAVTVPRIRVSMPNSGPVPSFNFTVSGGGAAASVNGTFASVQINPLPSLTVVNSPLRLNVGEAMTPVTPVSRSGGTPNFNWSISPTLPSGLDFDGLTGEISGTPLVASAERDYVVTVQDDFNADATATIRLATLAPVPVINLAAVPSATQQTVGRDYTFTVTPSVTGAATTGTLTLTTTLPDFQLFSSGTGTGWSCNAAGQVVTCTSNTSIAAGSSGNPVTITVTPATALVYSQAFSISGGGAAAAGTTTAAAVTVNGLPVTTPTSAGEILAVNNAVAQFNPVIRTSGGTAPFTWSVSPDLPTGLAYDSRTGRISGTPTVVTATTTYTYAVTDGRGATSSSTATLTVQAPAPSITSISPNTGPVAGGTPVTINGANLNGATQVNFGGTIIQAADLTPVSANAVRFNTPAGTAGAVDVSITTAGGTSADTPNDNFTYLAAPTATVQLSKATIVEDGADQSRYTITVTNPNALPLSGVGFIQTLPNGVGLASLSQTGCGGDESLSSASGFSFLGRTLAANQSCIVTAVVTSVAQGTYNLTLDSLSSAVGAGTLPTAATLTVIPRRPILNVVSPRVGPLAGNTEVTLTGTRLANATSVNFGSTVVPASQFISNTDSTITLRSPAGAAGLINITVTTAGGTNENILNGGFTYVLPPTASVEFLDTSIPADGSTAARYRVTVSNPNAVALPDVSFSQSFPSGLTLAALANTCNGFRATVGGGNIGYTFASGSLAANASCSVTASLYSATPGSYNITLSSLTSAGGDGTLPTTATALTVAPLTPSITGVSPAVGPLAGNIPVTISGTNLLNATQVVFGGTTIQSTSFTSNTDTAITVNAPSGTAGAVDISVTTPNGTDTEVAAFTYGAVPVLTAFTHADAIPYNAGGAAASTIDAAVASSPTGSPTSYAISAASANGAVVSVTNGGAVSYTPAAGFHGTDTFGLTASNAFGASAQVTVTVTVTNPSFIASGVGANATVGAPYLANVTLLGGTGPYSAFSATGLPDGLTISSAGTISGIPTTAGTFNALVVSATDSSTPPFTAAASNRLRITVAQGTQTITFNDPGAQDFGTSPTLTASATSGLGVTFSSLTSAVCTVTSGGALTLVAAGNCQIAADQAGNANYLAAPQVTRSFTVNAIDQVITFTNPGAQTMGTSPTVTATSTSGLTVAFSSLTPAVCTVTSGGALTLVAAGTCEIAADQAGNGGINAATRITRSFNVNLASQTITFADPGAQVMGTAPTLSATASSGLTVAFSSLTTPVCTITSGGALTLVSAGTCEITADQAGNGTFAAASRVTRSFAVNLAAQTITFANPGAQTMGTSPSVSATATSGLTVTFSSVTPAVCTVTSGGALTLVAAGNCQIAADQAGNGAFAAAAQVTQSFAVNTAAQTITFANPGAQTMGTSPTITATATSGLTVTFTSLTTAVCTVTTDGALTFVTVGNCEIAADQAGNGTFAPAAQVTQSFAVGQQGQTIDLPTPLPFGGKDAFAPGDQVSLAARSSSGLPVVFTGLTPQICSISSDGLLTFLKPGTCSVAADQPGNAVVAAAARVVASIQVGGVDPEAEVDLVTNMQVARARSLLFNQPDLSPLLEPEANESTAINVSTRGADIDLVRVGGPTWMRMSGSMSRQEGGASTGYLQFSLGTHARLGPNTILGLMGTVDTMRMDDPLGTTEGEGWLVGPYFVSKLGQSALVLEMRALSGRTHDSVAQTGQSASTVWGDRTLLMAKLSGSYQVNEKLALMPSINLAAVNSSSDPYTAAGGTQIAAVRTAYRQQSVDIDWRYEAENSAGKHVFFGGLGWFNSQEQQVRAGQGLKYSVGISQDFGTNSNVRFEVTGARDFDNKTNRLGASLLFSSQF